MPEGPEIRLAADRIARALVDRRVDDVYFGLPRLRRHRETLLGSRVTAVDTRGKAMLTRFDNGLTLYSHNQLYGRWYTTARDRRPKTNRDLRVALHNERHSAWLYSASDIEVLTDTEVDEHPFLNRLGPDILDETTTADALAGRLASDRFARRALGGLYLDQGFLAGIGNYLRSEILFCARLHPSSRPTDLDPGDLRRLARESLKLARRSYRTRGITLPESRVRRLKSGGEKRRGYRFWVFGRDGLPCRCCGSTIERMDAGSRRLYWCADCQPRIR